MKKLFTFIMLSIFTVLTANAQETTWSVIGDFPVCDNWKVDVPMVKGDDNIWTAVFENVDAGDYAFKVRANGTWVEAYPGNNYLLHVNAPKSTVTITFNESTHEIDAKQVSDEAPVEIKYTYTVIGSFPASKDWTIDIDMVESPEGTWTAVIKDVAAGEYKFKVRANKTWSIAYPSTDKVVTVAEDNTTVTIVFTESDNDIKVTQAVSTGINSLRAADASVKGYNLGGVKANKGLVIKNQKKYVVK